MWLLDQWAERHILDAQAKGEFDNLPGSGEPLTLDDDSHVPAELRAGYRLLKNAGCLPPELEQRRGGGSGRLAEGCASERPAAWRTQQAPCSARA